MTTTANAAVPAALNSLKNGGGHSLGDTWISFDSTVPTGGVPFCGQTVTRAMYGDLFTWAQAQGKVKTESDWQSIASANGGNCPYYSSGDGSTNFRMPAVVGYFKGAASASQGGEYLAEGLPNITGEPGPGTSGATTVTSSGAFYYDKNTGRTTYGVYKETGTNSAWYKAALDASKCSSIYGNSSHVTPETFTVLVGVYALGVVTSLGSADLDGVQTALAAIETKMDAYSPDAYITAKGQSGTSWWRTYSDGFIVQGTRASISNGGPITVAWPKPFSSTNYSVCAYTVSGGASNEWEGAGRVTSMTNSSVQIKSSFDESATLSVIAFGY